MPNLSISHEAALQRIEMLRPEIQGIALQAGYVLTWGELRAFYWMTRCAVNVGLGLAPNAALAEYDASADFYSQRGTMRILIIDTETTGTQPAIDEICELAMIACTATSPAELPGIEKARKKWRFRTRRPMPAEATNVHGIRDQDLDQCPAFAAHADDVEEALKWAEAVLGYRVRFDLDMIAKELERCRRGNAIPADLRVLDAYALWQRAEPRTLSDASRAWLGEELAGAHGAEADAECSARVAARIIGSGVLGDGCGWEDILEPVQRPRYDVRGGKTYLLFGKHEGLSLDEIAVSDPGYLRWAIRQDFPIELEDLMRQALSAR